MIRCMLFISLLLLFTPAFVFAQSGPSPKSSSVSIDEVSVEAFPVYKDSDGDPATAIIDADDRVVLSAEGGIESVTDKLGELLAGTASETRLIAAINAATARDTTELTQRNITLTANNNTAITSTLTATTRTFIEIQPADPSAVYWVSLDGAAVVGTSRYCQGTFYAEFAKATSVHVIASEALTISVIEGGR